MKRKRKVKSRGLPIHQTLTFDMGEPVAIDGYSIGPNGRVALLKDGVEQLPVRAWVGAVRDREKSEKKLVQIPINTNNTHIGEIPALLQYDHLFAIDTSTKLINGTHVSVACVFECRLINTKYQMVFQTLFQCCFEFHGLETKQENYAWSLLIKSICSSEGYTPERLIGIITDSDLGEHSSYNSKSKPFFIDKLIPNGFNLIYAYDKGNALINKALKRCDKAAAKQLARIQSGAIPKHDAPEVMNAPCSHFRCWYSLDTQSGKNGWFKLAQVQVGGIVP